jgi:hypothetical protein
MVCKSYQMKIGKRTKIGNLTLKRRDNLRLGVAATVGRELNEFVSEQLSESSLIPTNVGSEQLFLELTNVISQ